MQDRPALIVTQSPRLGESAAAIANSSHQPAPGIQRGKRFPVEFVVGSRLWLRMPKQTLDYHCEGCARWGLCGGFRSRSGLREAKTIHRSRVAQFVE